MNDSLETTNCPLCHSTSLTGEQYDFHPYRVVHCAACGLWYMSPRMKEKHLMDIYKKDTYFEGGSDFGYSNADGGYECRSDTVRGSSRYFLKRMKAQGISGGSLLEIGCGYGYFLAEAKKHFDATTGLDFSPKAVQEARKLGLEVIEGGIESLAPGRLFNVITAINVIEHVYNPVEFLHALLKHLAPGGWLVLSTPMMNSFWRRLLGTRWPSFLIPEHVTYYDRRTLTDLFARCGMTEILPLPSAYMFPLNIIGHRAKLKMPAWTPRINFWMPSIMTALAGRRPAK